MVPPRLLMILTENETMLPSRDMRSVVGLAKVAEETGFDAVMITEQTMLGGDAATFSGLSQP